MRNLHKNGDTTTNINPQMALKITLFWTHKKKKKQETILHIPHKILIQFLHDVSEIKL